MRIFKRKGLSRMKRPPQVNCSIYGRMFKSRRALNKHILDKRPCRPIEGYSRNNIIEQEIDSELANMKTHIYQGTQYNFSGLLTGNRHMRTGIPLPRISKYGRAAI